MVIEVYGVCGGRLGAERTKLCRQNFCRVVDAKDTNNAEMLAAASA